MADGVNAFVPGNVFISTTSLPQNLKKIMDSRLVCSCVHLPKRKIVTNGKRERFRPIASQKPPNPPVTGESKRIRSLSVYAPMGHGPCPMGHGRSWGMWCLFIACAAAVSAYGCVVGSAGRLMALIRHCSLTWTQREKCAAASPIG